VASGCFFVRQDIRRFFFTRIVFQTVVFKHQLGFKHLSTMDATPPVKATDAVLVHSEPVPDDAREVKGIDWAALPAEQRHVIGDFVRSLTSQGFQSSSIGDAINIINDMVRHPATAWSSQF
jgi:hypothetical protein